MAILYDTSRLPPAEQFAFWREAVCESLIGMRAERRDDQPFDARIEFHMLGSIGLGLGRLPVQTMYRTPADIARGQGAAYCLHLTASGMATGHYRGEDYTARAGDLLLIDTSLPTRWDVHEMGGSTFVHIPRHLIDARLPAPVQAPLRLSGADGMGVLIAGYMNSLPHAIATCDPAAALKAGDILCDLVAAAIAPSIPQGESRGVRDARLAAAKRYLVQNLTDPELSVARVARHLGVSERYVHKMFEATGQTFGETLLAARIEACGRVLQDPTQDHRTVADIAFGFGFGDLSWFYRRYRARWGETPRETRLRRRSAWSGAA
jgi:AraC family transcriptional activator of tynA and feaB